MAQWTYGSGTLSPIKPHQLFKLWIALKSHKISCQYTDAISNAVSVGELDRWREETYSRRIVHFFTQEDLHSIFHKIGVRPIQD